jgi:4-hydroxybenzoate polyprenyltransferase
MGIWEITRYLFRAEYWVGLWIGAVATVVLWYDPALSPRLSTIALTFVFSGTLYSTGFLANAIGDRELDPHYQSSKRLIAKTVEHVGIRPLLTILSLALVVGLALGIWLSLLLSTTIPLLLAGIGIVAGVGYSLPPLRWKERGFLFHALSLGLSAFFLPFYLVAGILYGSFSNEILLIAFGYTITHYGMEIGNQLKDYKRDRENGIFTLPSRSPLVSCGVGFILIMFGLSIEVVLFSRLFQLSANQLGFIAVILFTTHAPPLRKYGLALKNLGGNISLFSELNYARWQTLGMIGYLLTASIIRIWSS